MQNPEHVVFKRAKHKSHDESHGGAWKVAFADFMIALMALFLVLWILQVSDVEERRDIMSGIHDAYSFNKSFNFLLNNSPNVMPNESPDSSHLSSAELDSHVSSSPFQGDGEGLETNALVEGNLDTEKQLSAFANLIQNLAHQLNAEENINLDVTPEGLRIVLQDDKQQEMFLKGGERLTPFFEDLLFMLAPIFQNITNQLIISGHTDSTKFRKHFSSVSNWELSVNRANQARKTLTHGGMPEDRILQVTGMSDRTLLNFEKPTSSENRRIELFVLTTTTAQMLETLFGQQQSSQTRQAIQGATANQPVIRSQKTSVITVPTISENTDINTHSNMNTNFNINTNPNINTINNIF